MEGDENYRGFLVRDVAVYMVINEHLNVEKLSNTSEYSPEIAAYNMACSYSLFVLGSFRGENRRMNGINNLFKKAMITIKSVISLLAGGNSCDAVILWRHLHELECVLLVLNNADDEMFFKYIKHMEYFNMEGSPNGEELQKRLSEECKQYGVKERNALSITAGFYTCPDSRKKWARNTASISKRACSALRGREAGIPPMRAQARSCTPRRGS